MLEVGAQGADCRDRRPQGHLLLYPISVGPGDSCCAGILGILGISLTQAPQRAQYSTCLCARRSTTCRGCRVTTALNNQGDQCEIATWISPHHDPAWANRRTGVIPASSVRWDQWCHIEYANFERANFCSAGNKSGQFQPGDDHALSERSPPRGFNFNCHRM